MFGDFEVSLRQDIRRGTYKVFMYQRTGNHETVFITKKGEGVTVKEGDKIDDNDIMFAEMTRDQLSAFAEELSSLGIKTNHDSIAEGKLAATERHLQDMRTIALSKYGGA